jgi:GWxTD domain-containing protein
MSIRKNFRRGAATALPLFITAVLELCSVSRSAAWVEGLDMPAASTGEIIFYADVVSFSLDETQDLEEIYVVVSNDQIEFVEKDGALRGELRYEVNVLDRDQKVVGGSNKTITVDASSEDDAADRSVVQVLQSRVGLPPGSYTAEVVLEDLNARRKEIVSYIMGKYKRGEVELQFESPEFGPESITLSDIEFARSLRRTPEGAFAKSGFEVIPNAQRRYGLLLSELPIYFEVYDFGNTHLGDTLLVRYTIVGSAGNRMFEAENPVKISGRTLGSTALFDIASLPTGNYLLVLDLLDDQGQVLASTKRKFDVLWSVYSWGRYEIEALGDLAYVLTEDEMERFKTLTPAEREDFLKEFWLSIDPTPGTAVNEALIEHFRRVKYADHHFGGAGIRGALTDRGRLYIKYGPPDDIQSHYSDYEFVQGTREIEGGSEPVPTDPFSRVGIKTGSSGADSWDQTGSETEALADQRGGSTVHGKAYEIWSYDGTGDPVRRLSDRVPRAAKMRFVLVDERGFGDYKLVYSTEKEEY